MEHASIKELREKILKDLESYDISKYSLSDIEKSIKNKFISEKIKEFNIFELNNHKLVRENYQTVKGDLLNDDTFNFDEIENKIKEVFEVITKDDKIKEVTPSLNFEKIFKMSSYNYLEKYKDSNYKLIESNKAILSNDITKKVLELKEVVLSSYGFEDKYYRFEKIKEIVDFLKYAYDIKIDLGDYNEVYKMDLKDIENLFNQNTDIKIRFFGSWYYLTLKDESKQKDFKMKLIENQLGYMLRD